MKSQTILQTVINNTNNTLIAQYLIAEIWKGEGWELRRFIFSFYFFFLLKVTAFDVPSELSKWR